MTPIHCPYRPPPPQYRAQAQKILEQLERENIITRQYAPFAAQIRWVVKSAPDDHSRIPGQKLQTNKEAELRMAIDYSHMQGRVTKQQFPLTPVKKILALLRNSKVISSIDLRKAFYQIEVCDESKLVWAFEGRTVIIFGSLHGYKKSIYNNRDTATTRTWDKYLSLFVFLFQDNQVNIAKYY